MKRRYIVSILLVVVFTAIKGQPTEQYEKGTGEYLEVMLDNAYYLAGESVFYTIAYSCEKKGRNPEGITIFAELLDSVNFRLASACHRTDAEGYTRGALTIPTSASSGYYILRFYTYTMMVQGPQTYQYKLIPVLNPAKGIPVVRDKDKYEGLHIEFLPEGNHWVSGVENNMVIKCRNFAGQAIHCKALVTQNKRILDTLNFDQNGTAFLRLIPYQDTLIKLVMNIEDSTRKEFLFPRPEKTGTTLFVYQIARDTLFVKIGKNTTMHQEGEYTLLVRDGRKTISNLVFPLSSRDTILALAIETLADGFYELQLMDEKKQIMNQTSFNLERPNEPEILIPARTYRRGDSIRFEIRFREAESAPDWISVRASWNPEILKRNTGKEYGIINAIPVHILPSVSTQVGRHYEIPSDGKGFILSGDAKYRSTGNPAANLLVRIAITNGRKDIYQVCTDSSGRFNLAMKGMSGRVIAIFQPVKNEPIQNIDIIPFSQFSEDYISFHIPKLAFPEGKITDLNEFAKISFVEQNYTANTETLPSERDQWVFYGKADEVIDMNDFIELPQMEEVFRELSKYILISGSGKNLRIQVLDKYTNRITGNNPLILIDGVPMDSHQQVLAIKPSSVKRIAVVAGKYFYRGSRFDGIIDIELRKKNPGLYSEYVTKEYMGYADYQERQFPEYSGISRRSYWQPYMKGRNGVFQGVFRAGDIPGSYTIYVDGKDRKGRTVRKEAFVLVK